MTRILMWPVWWLAVLATIGTGAFWGHQATSTSWRQASELPYVSAGGAYTAAAVALFLGAAALEAFRGPRVCRRLALAAAAVFAVLAVRAVAFVNDVAFNEDPGAFANGAGEPLMAPWAWLLILGGLWGWTRIVWANRSDTVPASPHLR